MKIRERRRAQTDAQACAEGVRRFARGDQIQASTGIDEAITYGYGDLDHHGFWQYPVPAALVEMRAALRAEIAGMEGKYRTSLWLRHGHPISALYGDDGEMQCCYFGCMLDFKRLPLAVLERRITELTLAPVAQESRSAERRTHGQADAAAEPPTSRPGDTAGNPGSNAAAGRDPGSIPGGGTLATRDDTAHQLAMRVLQSDLYRQDPDARELVDALLPRRVDLLSRPART